MFDSKQAFILLEDLGYASFFILSTSSSQLFSMRLGILIRSRFELCILIEYDLTSIIISVSLVEKDGLIIDESTDTESLKIAFGIL